MGTKRGRIGRGEGEGGKSGRCRKGRRGKVEMAKKVLLWVTWQRITTHDRGLIAASFFGSLTSYRNGRNVS
jgi:hypothetical protein